MSDKPGADQLARMLEQWPAGQSGLKDAFLRLKARAEALPAATWSFVVRPGVTSSLRITLSPAPKWRSRILFFLVDVVPMGEEWMLSACFYADEVEDPEERGNLVPNGLFEEDGYCFDLDDWDPDLLAYVEKRLAEAHLSAALPA